MRPAMIGRLTSMNFGTSHSSCWLSVVALLNSIPSRAITPRTKMIIVNTPHNPVGKVFTKQELEFIAALAQEFNLLVMSDEVVGVTQQRDHVYNIWVIIAV
jgi:cystathionine beta-lyase/cystathionine gamma-synthase